VELHHYLEPYKIKKLLIPGISEEYSLASKVSFFEGSVKWFLNFNFSIVIIGINESLFGEANNKKLENPDEIRKWLYSFRGDYSNVKIADAGNIKGNTIKDMHFALKDVTDFFIAKNVVVIVFGGAHNVMMPVFESYICHHKLATLAVGDAMLDVNPFSINACSKSWLSHIINTFGERLDDLIVFGVQNYLTSSEQENYINCRFFEILRLGDIRNDDIQKLEIALRDADIVSFDFNMITNQRPFNENVASPHGIEPFNACAAARYAGISDKVRVFCLAEILNFNDNDQNSVLAAQMIWHFIDGVFSRYNDYPAKSINEYQTYCVDFDSYDNSINFFHNSSNNRWWMEVNKRNGKHIVACSPNDVEVAKNKEIPNKWWRFFLKDKSQCENDN
jgi:formiminoglutamase